jgi:hypothetical protein
MISSQVAVDAGLDELEKEYGMNLGIGAIGGGVSNADHNSTEPAELPSSEANVDSIQSRVDQGHNSARGGGSVGSKGCLQLSWLFGMFSGSLPPLNSCSVWDWVLLKDEHYAGR